MAVEKVDGEDSEDGPGGAERGSEKVGGEIHVKYVKTGEFA